MSICCAWARGRSLLIDFIPLERLSAMYPELWSYIEDSSLVFFETCLTQMRQGDLQLLVEGLLSIPWLKLGSYHVPLACTTCAIRQWRELL